MARRGKKGSCAMVVQTDNGKDSILHKELQKRYKNRAFTNYIYAVYKLPSVLQAMDLARFRRNSTNEHNIRDVINFLDISRAYEDANQDTIFREAYRLNFVDQMGNLVEFTDSETALNKALQYNNGNHPGSFAMVTLKGDKFSVMVRALDTSSYTLKNETALNKQVWDFVKNALATHNIRLDDPAVDKERFNTVRAKLIANWMYNISLTRNNLLLTGDIKGLLSVNANTSQVQQLLNRFGQNAPTIQELIENAALAVYDYYRNNLANVTPGLAALIQATIDNCKNFLGADVVTLNRLVDNMINTFNSNSIESGVKTTLQELDRKYNLLAKEFVKLGNQIDSLQDAAMLSSFTLKRQLAEMKYYQGVTPEATRVEQALNQLMDEINSNKYTQGLIYFLGEAKNQLIGNGTVDGIYQRLLNLANVLGTALEKGKERADVLTELKRFSDGYMTILDALVNIDKLQNTTAEVIDPALRDLIQLTAKDLYDKFLELALTLRRVERETVKDLVVEYIGDELYNGTSINDILEMQELDSTLMDHLYSMSRVSNPLINTMGNIIRQMRMDKNKEMIDIARRIRTERDALRKAKMDDRFMIGDDGYIISEYDIPAYNEARRRAWKQFKRLGLSGLRLDAAMDNWIQLNSEEVVVDRRSGRKERVPGLAYRRAFPQLNAALERYYINMMQIKGELGTMLPMYAQRLFIPPQLRKNWLDGMRDAMLNKKGLRGYLQTLEEWTRLTKNKVRGLWHIWEDDTEYVANGILNGEDINIVDGAMDNTPFRRIPIFYVNNLKDSRDLLVSDFAGALQHLAGTAINYKHVNNVKNVIERMGDYIKGSGKQSSKNKGINQYDVVEDGLVRMFKALSKAGDATKNSGLIDDLVAKHLYGVELKDLGKWTKLAKNFLIYNSIRKLAVNIKGAVNNYIVGEYQMLIEGLSGTFMKHLHLIKYKGLPLVKTGLEFYTLGNFAWAHAHLFTEKVKPLVLIDLTTGNKASKDVLLAMRFDPKLENFDELAHERYYKTWFRRWSSNDKTFIGYGLGEHVIHYINMYSLLDSIKVKINGKSRGGAKNLFRKYNLYDALYVKNVVNHNGELGIKAGTTYEMPDGSEVPVDEEFLDLIQAMIEYCNQNHHGSMNLADKGVIHQRMAMRYIMNLRQWMVEHYSRRFRGTHYDASLNNTMVSKVREGHQTSTAKIAWNYAKMGTKAFAEYGAVAKFLNSFGIYGDRIKTDAALRWKNLRPDQQLNALRTLAEVILANMVSMLGSTMTVWKDNDEIDEEHKWAFMWWLYQVKRTNFDAWASLPIIFSKNNTFTELNTLVNSPVSSTNTFNETVYPIYGWIYDWGEDVGPRTMNAEWWNDEGLTGGKKYWFKCLRYTAPFYRLIQQTINFANEEGVFNVFEKDPLQQ